MARTESKNSRRVLSKNGWKILRSYIKEKNKKRLDLYQVDNNFPNVDLALDDALEKYFNSIGGMKK